MKALAKIAIAFFALFIVFGISGVITMYVKEDSIASHLNGSFNFIHSVGDEFLEDSFNLDDFNSNFKYSDAINKIREFNESNMPYSESRDISLEGINNIKIIDSMGILSLEQYGYEGGLSLEIKSDNEEDSYYNLKVDSSDGNLIIALEYPKLADYNSENNLIAKTSLKVLIPRKYKGNIEVSTNKSYASVSSLDIDGEFKFDSYYSVLDGFYVKAKEMNISSSKSEIKLESAVSGEAFEVFLDKAVLEVLNFESPVSGLKTYQSVVNLDNIVGSIKSESLEKTAIGFSFKEILGDCNISGRHSSVSLSYPEKLSVNVKLFGDKVSISDGIGLIHSGDDFNYEKKIEGSKYNITLGPLEKCSVDIRYI